MECINHKQLQHHLKPLPPDTQDELIPETTKRVNPHYQYHKQVNDNHSDLLNSLYLY